MIEFLNPWAWLGLIAVPLAALCLLWRRRPLEVPVPSVIHWKATPEEDEEGARRLRVEALTSILLVAAAVTALVAAIARPVVILSEGEGRARVIIDRSASMRTIAGDRTRLDLAKDHAVRLIRGWGSGVRVTVDSLPGGDAEADLPPAEAIRAVGRVAPSILPLDLDGRLPVILPARDRDDRVFLFTDRVPAGASGSEVAVSSVGGPSDNVGITEFEVGPEWVFASVGNFSAEARDVPLRLEGRRPTGEAVGGEVTLSIPSGEERVWKFEVPPLEEVEVRVVGDDSLPLDDFARAVVLAADPLRCEVIGGPCPSVERALSATRGVEVVNRSDGEAGPIHLTVHYRRLPEGSPEGPIVLIDPPGSWGGIEVGPVAPSPEGILPCPGPWEDLSLTGVHLGSARSLTGHRIVPIIRSLPGGETVAGRLEGDLWRAIAIAFDPEGEGTDWTDRVSFPIFWAKVAEWAGLQPERAPILRGGDRMSFQVDFPPARIVGPEGEEIARFESAGPASWQPEGTGVYVLEDRVGRRHFSVNLLSRAESRNGGAPREIPAAARQVPLRDPRRGEGWPLLVCLFVTLAAIEWGARRERIVR